MNTLAWLLILLGAIVVRAASKGRGLSDLPGDLGDFFVKALSGDMEGAKEAASRRGSVATTVDVGAAVGLGGPSRTLTGLGKVDARLPKIAGTLTARFPAITNVTGYRDTAGYGQADHASGKSIDVFVADKATGDAVSAFLVSNAGSFDVKYVIWYQRIWYPTSGWRTMQDRGSDNNNHKNHVHLTIN
jgi:hypothetical protein